MTVSPAVRHVAALVALAGLYYLAARLGLLLSFDQTNASPVWPPSGIALAALIVRGSGLWPAILVGAWAANMAVFSANDVAGGWLSSAVSLVIAMGNVGEALLARAMLRHLHTDVGRLSGSEAPYRFALAAALAAAFGAAVGSSALVLGGIAAPAAQSAIAATWWLGDAAGMLVLTPLLVLPAPRHWRWASADVARAGVAVLALVLLLYLLFGRAYAGAGGRAWAYALLPCIGWAAWRYGQCGVGWTLLLGTGAAVWSTTRGLGPFSAGTLNDALIALGIFVGLCSVVGLALAADIARNGWQRSALWHWMTLFGGLGLTILAWQTTGVEAERQAHARFAYLSEQAHGRVERRLVEHANLLRAAQGLLSASATVDADAWARFVERLDIDVNFPGVQGLGYARGTAQGARAGRAVVTLLEPRTQANVRAIGAELEPDATRRAALAAAARSAGLAVSPALTLAPEQGRAAGVGVRMYLPLHEADPAPARRERVGAGFVFAALRIDALMDAMLGPSAPLMRLRIVDGGQGGALVYDSDGGAGGAAYPAALSVAKPLAVAGSDQRWLLQFASKPAFEATIDRQKALIVLVAGTMLSTLFFGIVRNLTATRDSARALASQVTGTLDQTSATLRQSEERFRLFTSRVTNYSILFLDPQGVVTTWNDGARNLLGYSADEIVGRNFTLFYSSEDIAAGKPAALLAQARMQGQCEDSSWRVRADGSAFAAVTRLTSIHDEHAGLLGYAEIMRDVSAERQIEHDLRTAMSQAEAASKAKSAFVANMSHELRTPMNAVLGMAYLLEKTPLSSQQANYLSMIRDSGQALLAIMNDILDFSRIEAGRIELEARPFALAPVLKSVANIMSVSAGEKDLVLLIDVAVDVPHHLTGDMLRLQQVLVNLVGNAIKFTEHGQVCLEIGVRGDRLHIAVSDTGIGMTAQQQARLFLPFTQADSSTARRFGGSGLGLTICKQLVELMAGTIAVTSDIGAGSRFDVSLPLLAAATPHRPDAPGVSVLALEPHAASADCLRKAAARLGWQCTCVDDVAHALAAVAAAHARGAQFDLVLFDCALIAGQAQDAVLALREAPGLQHRPMALMASAFGRGLAVDPRHARLDGSVLKPVVEDALAQLLLDARARRGALARPGETAPLRLHGVHLLLAEDNALNRIVAKSMLELAGATLDIVDDGSEALERLRQAPARYSLVLMDVQMPVMDGFAATRAIREELGLSLPILAMTAGVTEADQRQCHEAGMNDFIGKPIDVAQMLGAIVRNLAPQAPPASARAAGARDAAIFNLAQVQAISGGDGANVASLARIVQNLTREACAPVEAARRCWQGGETAQAQRTLHALRGSIGSLGAERFAAAALALEQALDGQAGGALEQGFDDVARELALALAALDQWSRPYLDAPAAPGAQSEAQLAELSVMLERHDMAACATYRAQRAHWCACLDEAAFARLEQAMDQLDFAAARALVDAAR
jgi:PAS domain S-box-containing protein